MRRRWLLMFVAAVSVLVVPAPASAQVRIISFGRPYYYGGYPYTFGGYGYPSYYGGMAPGGYGYGYGWYNQPALGYSIPAYSGLVSGPIYWPGWMAGSSDAVPRARPTLAPAVRVQAAEITPAGYSLGGPDTTATLEVKVPTLDTEIWFQGVKMQQIGTTREFVSPGLEPGYNYSYDIRIRWQDRSGVHESSRTVRVQAGQRIRVDFTTLPPPKKL